MPRPKGADAPSPKKRSRTGCRGCKLRKVKCGEEKPRCDHCVKQGDVCDYSVHLRWGGRSKKDQEAFAARGQLSNSPAPWSAFTVFSPAATPTPGPLTPSATSTTSQHQKQRAEDPRLHVSSCTLDPQLMAGAPVSDIGSTPASHHENQHDLTHSLPRAAPSQPQANFIDSQSPHYTGQLPSQLPSTGFHWSEQHRPKRVKLSSHQTTRSNMPPLSETIMSRNSGIEQASSGSATLTTLGTSDSSVASSDEAHLRYLPRLSATSTGTPSAMRRLSVNSLLSGPPNNGDPTRSQGLTILDPESDGEGSIIYGHDLGFPDLDISRNNDSMAIIAQNPAGVAAGESPSATAALDRSLPRPSNEAAFQRGGYYAQPVAIKIPLAIGPLPPYLTDSPMNLLYFHHFLNHTARVLTPHDCPDNPLRTILPRMALHNADLMNLLFAYSASHRARLLGHPEPKDRIAYWVRDVFPNLRHALSSREPVSDATLATAIMLASREIVTPNTFEVNIPWQNHLGIARQMIIQRGGLRRMGDDRNPEVNFLARWFAYLDVIGSLSGYKNDAPLSEAYWSFPQDSTVHGMGNDTEEDEHGFAIDCFFGFTNCCISLLARVAKLAHECDKERIGTDSTVNPDWSPSVEMRETAEKLAVALSETKGHVYAGCRHSGSDKRDWDTISDATKLDLQEIVSVNEAFHLAGLIHLYRRVMARPRTDGEVQYCVRQVVAVLGQIRKGGTAESCLLFPMFTAGCDAIDAEHRALILERLELVEGLGMTHVQKARLLMETSWETGRAWETLVSGEFFG